MSVYYLLCSLFYEITRCEGVEEAEGVGVEDGDGVNGVKDGECDGECDGGEILLM